MNKIKSLILNAYHVIVFYVIKCGVMVFNKLAFNVINLKKIKASSLEESFKAALAETSPSDKQYLNIQEKMKTSRRNFEYIQGSVIDKNSRKKIKTKQIVDEIKKIGRNL